MLHKGLFVLGHQLGDPHFYSYYKLLQKNQWKKHKDLVIEQEKKLRTALHFSYENVPYYTKLFHRLNLKPTDIRTTADLEKLPILNKGIIKQHWEEFKPLGLKKIKYEERMTSGSSGTPFPYRLSRHDRFSGAAHLYRGWGYGGYELGDRMVFLAGTALATGTGSTLSKKVYETVRNIRMLSSWGMGEQEMREYTAVINSCKPLFIRGYASSIFFFAKWIEENTIPIHHPEVIFTATEKLYPPMREKISRVFNCDVLDGYGAYDGSITANECTEHTGFHIDTERSLMEVVDERGNQIQEGEGKILATSLCNSAMSFIRYDTGDVGNILSEADTCACGRGYRLLKELIGRSSDILITPDGKYVQGWYLAMTVQEFWKDQVKEFQVVQETPEKIIYNVVPEKHFDERLLEKIQQNMHERGFHWEIELRIVEEIERTRSGKYRFIINKIPTGRV
jgi:phenylacetate-CoA ligase